MDKLITLGLLFFLTGCTVVYMHNGQYTDEPPREKKETYRLIYLQLKTINGPFDISKRCKEGRWKTVKIERDLIDSIASLPPFSVYYSPWEVTISCEDGYYADWSDEKTKPLVGNIRDSIKERIKEIKAKTQPKP